MADDELILAIVIPKLGPSQRGLWVKLGNRRSQAISVLHAGIVIDLDAEVVTGARMAFGSLAATVVSAEDLASDAGRARAQRRS